MSTQTWFFLDGRERHLVDDALQYIQERDGAHCEGLRTELASLAQLAATIRDSEPIWQVVHTSRPVDSGDALVALMGTMMDFDKELHLPTRATLGQAYLLSKIHFLENLAHVLARVDAPSTLTQRAQTEWGQSLYSRMAENILINIAMDGNGDGEARVHAGRILFHLWEERLLVEIDDFAPLLESAWVARSRVQPVLGTMLGTHEVMHLFQLARDDRLLAYFSGESVPEEHLQAFQEFIFGLSHESIQVLRERMDEQNIAALSVEEARQLLDIKEEIQFLNVPTPQALYTSYRERRVKAQSRRLTGVAGPKKTAEEYALNHLLSTTDIMAGLRRPQQV